MKDSDRILLDGLRATVCADVPQDHWDLVVKATEEAGDVRLVDGYAGTVLHDAIEKAKKKRNKIQTVMGEFKEGKLESSSGEKVTNPKQAIAIALSEQRRAKKKKVKKSDVEVEKASFSSRSEAGRYAAEQRWKDHVKREPSGGQLKYSRAGDIPEDLRRALFRWMDPDGPQTSADALRALVSGGVLTPDMLNNNDRELLGYPPLQGKRQQLPKGYMEAEAKTDSKPFLDLTDVDPQGKMEAGAKPAKAPKESASPETVKRIKEGDLSEIADVIRRDLRAQGKKVPFGAQPYLDAMSSLGSITEKYGEDSGSSIVAYLLSNLTSYKGAIAREVKAELNRRFKEEGRKIDARQAAYDTWARA